MATHPPENALDPPARPHHLLVSSDVYSLVTVIEEHSKNGLLVLKVLSQRNA